MKTPVIAVLVSLAWVFPAVQAATIFSHDFSGGGGDLDGLPPNSGAGAWVASSQFNADGSIVNNAGSGTQGGSATLAFTPVDGLVYTLDASFTGVNGDGNWLALGFADGQSATVGLGNRFINNDSIGKAWMLYRGDTSTNGNVAWLGSSTAGTGDGIGYSPDFPGGGSIDLRIVLDTTGGTGNWTATWFAKLPASGTYTEVRPEAALIDETITAVGIAKSNDGVTGTITSFQLTSIPEPSALALVGLGGLLSAFSRRRR